MVWYRIRVSQGHTPHPKIYREPPRANVIQYIRTVMDLNLMFLYMYTLQTPSVYLFIPSVLKLLQITPQFCKISSASPTYLNFLTSTSCLHPLF